MRTRQCVSVLFAVALAAALLGVDGSDAPALAFDGLPALRSLAFNAQGALFGAASDAGVVQVLAPKLSQSLAKTGGAPAGLAFGADGNLYVADRARKAVLRIRPWGEVTAAAERCGGRALVAPADVAATKSAIYFTDSGASIVCRLEASGEAWVVTDKIAGPLGIAVSADDRRIYAGDAGGVIWAAGREGVRKVASVGGRATGMALDERGNIYVAAQGAAKAAVLSPEGKALKEYSVPGDASGVTFGRVDRSSLFISDPKNGSIYRATALAPAQRAAWERDEPLRIAEPFDGAILNRHDGAMTPQGLRITVSGTVRGAAPVRVNRVPATMQGDAFRAAVVLDRRENRIVAEAAGGLRNEITVLWDKDSFPRYRFSVDDNIRWLKDIALHQPPYRSIFENPYLGFWREMHRKYGAKIHFNIYYETSGFTLAQMPVRFRPEWQQNAGWLRLTFHARANDPDRPYLHSTAQRIRDDYRLVMREIERFAGKELLSDVTTVHWGETTSAAVDALRAEGVKALVGYFELRRELPSVCYDVTVPQLLYLMRHDYWKDTRRDLLFVRHDMVVNNVDLDQIVPRLEQLAADPHQSEVIELMIHEQQYYPDFIPGYRPDYRQRVERAIRWVTERGYKPVFYSEGLAGARAVASPSGRHLPDHDL